MDQQSLMESYTKDTLERFMAAVVEKSQDFITLATPDLTPFFVNEAGRHMVGLDSIEDVRKSKLLDYFAPEDRPLIQLHAIPTLQQKGRWSGEVRFQNFKTGQLIHTLWNAFALKDESGRVVAWAAISPNLNRLKEAEEAHHQSEKRLRATFDKAGVGIVEVEANDRFIAVNDRVCEMLGYTSDELLKMDVHQLTAPEDRPLSDEINKKIHDGGSDRISYEKRYLKKDGTPLWVSVSVSAVRDAKGRWQRSITTVEDITERRQAEEALRNSEERFRLLADSMPQLVWTARPDGIVDYYNRRVDMYKGFSKNRDGSWAWGPVLHPDDVKKTLDVWNNALQTGETYEVEHRVQMKDGEFRWHLSRGVLHKDMQGRPIKWFGTATDIHSSKESEIQLAQKAQELTESNADLEQFAHVASHDLQEPLRKISNYSELLSIKYHNQLDENANKYISYLIEGTRRMQRLIADLLIFSRVGRRDIRFGIVPTKELVERVLIDMEPIIKEKGVEVEIGPLPHVKGHSSLIGQVFQNIISNAIKFCDLPKPHIRISVQEDQGNALFTIHDNGIGIEQEHWERIFNPFQRLHTREQYPGTGIGLAVCKKIIERHGGRIWVESQPRQGSTFYFILPLSK